MLVGFRQSNDYDLSYTGKLTGKLTASGAPAMAGQVTIDGHELLVDGNGLVIKSTPSSSYLGQTLRMVTTDMGDEGGVGGSVTRADGSSSYVSSMEPRDYFAMNALNAMLINMESPESKDDATCLMYSRAAYRWAQAMMIAAADSREGTSTSSSSTTTVEVKSGDLQSNIEKLLYNITLYLKDGR